MSNIKVDVVYALSDKQYFYSLKMPEGSSVKQAIMASGLLEICTEINLKKNKIGIFSRPVKLDDEIKNGDRIEIYRPLIADPKEWRRQRAERAAAKKRQLSALSVYCPPYNPLKLSVISS